MWITRLCTLISLSAMFTGSQNWLNPVMQRTKKMTGQCRERYLFMTMMNMHDVRSLSSYQKLQFQMLILGIQNCLEVMKKIMKIMMEIHDKADCHKISRLNRQQYASGKIYVSKHSQLLYVQHGSL